MVCLTTVDCRWRFVDCGPCSATCGDATQTCTPEITIEAENGGKECPEFVHSGKPQEKRCEGLKPCPGRRTFYITQLWPFGVIVLAKLLSH